jgi:hypothetical protein
LGAGIKMKLEERKIKMNYISEIRELYTMLRDIPCENSIEIATIKGRLKKVLEEYREKFYPASIMTPERIEDIRRTLDDLNPMWVSVACLDEGEIIKSCEVCCNATICCTCMGEDELD